MLKNYLIPQLSFSFSVTHPPTTRVFQNLNISQAKKCERYKSAFLKRDMSVLFVPPCSHLAETASETIESFAVS